MPLRALLGEDFVDRATRHDQIAKQSTSWRTSPSARAPSIASQIDPSTPVASSIITSTLAPWNPCRFTPAFSGEATSCLHGRVNSTAVPLVRRTEHGRSAVLSAEHFTVDGTLIEAWAATKSFKPKAGAVT